MTFPPIGHNRGHVTDKDHSRCRPWLDEPQFNFKLLKTQNNFCHWSTHHVTRREPISNSPHKYTSIPSKIPAGIKSETRRKGSRDPLQPISVEREGRENQTVSHLYREHFPAGFRVRATHTHTHTPHKRPTGLPSKNSTDGTTR